MRKINALALIWASLLCPVSSQAVQISFAGGGVLGLEMEVVQGGVKSVGFTETWNPSQEGDYLYWLLTLEATGPDSAVCGGACIPAVSSATMGVHFATADFAANEPFYQRTQWVVATSVDFEMNDPVDAYGQVNRNSFILPFGSAASEIPPRSFFVEAHEFSSDMSFSSVDIWDPHEGVVQSNVLASDYLTGPYSPNSGALPFPGGTEPDCAADCPISASVPSSVSFSAGASVHDAYTENIGGAGQSLHGASTLSLPAVDEFTSRVTVQIAIEFVEAPAVVPIPPAALLLSSALAALGFVRRQSAAA